MIKMLCVILPVFLLSSTLYGQKCKNLKDEIDPFTNKRIIMSRGFSLSPIEVNNTKPQINGQFVFENDLTYLNLNSSIIYANGGLSTPTENSKNLVDIKSNDYIIFKFEENEKIIKLSPMQASESNVQVVLGNTYFHSTGKFIISKDDLMEFALNKIERIRISKNNENTYFDYTLKSIEKKENVIFATKCFLTALEK